MLEPWGAVCLGMVLGWAAAGPRKRRFAIAELAVSVVLLASAVQAILATEAAAGGAAIGALGAFACRLLLDLGISGSVIEKGRR